MHPGFYSWWKSREHGSCGEGHPAHGPHGHGPHGAGPHCGPGFGHHGRWGGGFAHAAPGFEHDASSAFGVRRPLRFLAHKLNLDEAQVATFATILDELKTERAQAAVDQRRRISALAEALESSAFDEAKAQHAGEEQVKSAERVRSAVERALKRIHSVLDDEQRKTLAYLLRTGVLSI
ncbi:MAG: Spy/CpxP family protein refolding chaperone [Myxococcales bacterium]